jgi:AcrR family transcriptional regulator
MVKRLRRDLPGTIRRAQSVLVSRLARQWRNGGAIIKRRNPQETRRKLMGATVASLFELGYGGLSTVDVARRARVSRGGQLHHFPHKQALLAETVAHLFERRLAELRANIRKLPASPPEERLAAFIEASWPAFRSRSFYAWLELVVASRTDVKLRQASSKLIERFRGSGAELLQAALGPAVAGLDIDFGPLAALVLGNMEAMSLNLVAAGAGPRNEPQMPVRLEMLKTASALYLRHLIDAAQGAANRH